MSFAFTFAPAGYMVYLFSVLVSVTRVLRSHRLSRSGFAVTTATAYEGLKSLTMRALLAVMFRKGVNRAVGFNMEAN